VALAVGQSHVPDRHGAGCVGFGRLDFYGRAAEYAEYPQDDLDGLTVDCGDWWFNLRPSNTEPLLRLNLEAADRSSCDQHVAELLALITV